MGRFIDFSATISGDNVTQEGNEYIIGDNSAVTFTSNDTTFDDRYTFVIEFDFRYNPVLDSYGGFIDIMGRTGYGPTSYLRNYKSDGVHWTTNRSESSLAELDFSDWIHVKHTCYQMLRYLRVDVTDATGKTVTAYLAYTVNPSVDYIKAYNNDNSTLYFKSLSVYTLAETVPYTTDLTGFAYDRGNYFFIDEGGALSITPTQKNYPVHIEFDLSFSSLTAETRPFTVLEQSAMTADIYLYHDGSNWSLVAGSDKLEIPDFTSAHITIDCTVSSSSKVLWNAVVTIDNIDYSASVSYDSRWQFNNYNYALFYALLIEGSGMQDCYISNIICEVESSSSIITTTRTINNLAVDYKSIQDFAYDTVTTDLYYSQFGANYSYTKLSNNEITKDGYYLYAVNFLNSGSSVACDISNAYHYYYADYTEPTVEITQAKQTLSAVATLYPSLYDKSVKYLWSTGETTQSIRVSAEGVYTCQVTDSVNGVGESSFAVEFKSPTIRLKQVNNTLTPAITLDDNLEDTSIFYSWSTGEDTETIDITSDGVYSLTIIDSVGQTATRSITAKYVPTKPTVTIQQKKNLLTAVAAVDPSISQDVSYAWYSGVTPYTLTTVGNVEFNEGRYTFNGGYIYINLPKTLREYDVKGIFNLEFDLKVSGKGIAVHTEQGSPTYYQARFIAFSPQDNLLTRPSGVWRFYSSSYPSGRTGAQWGTYANLFASDWGDQVVHVAIHKDTNSTGYSLYITDANNTLIRYYPTRDVGYDVIRIGTMFVAEGYGEEELEGYVENIKLSYTTDTIISTEPTITITEDGEYSATITDAYKQTATSSIYARYNPLPPTVEIEQNGNILTAKATIDEAIADKTISYYWSTGATTQSINVSASGTYQVTVKDAIGGVGTTQYKVTLKVAVNLGEFDPLVTVQSQYSASPHILQLVRNFWDSINPTADAQTLYDNMLNIYTAIGKGLDTWGRIVGIARQYTDGGIYEYFGFEHDPQAEVQTFDNASFYAGKKVIALQSDEEYRTFLIVKAHINIGDSTLPSLNSMLKSVFPFTDIKLLHIGTMQLRLLVRNDVSESQLRALLKLNWIPAGVGLNLYKIYAPTFGFRGQELYNFNNSIFSFSTPEEVE